MVSTVVASILQSYLGKYLELSEISVGSEIHASDVRIRESAFTDLLVRLLVLLASTKKTQTKNVSCRPAAPQALAPGRAVRLRQVFKLLKLCSLGLITSGLLLYERTLF